MMPGKLWVDCFGKAFLWRFEFPNGERYGNMEDSNSELQKPAIKIPAGSLGDFLPAYKRFWKTIKMDGIDP